MISNELDRRPDDNPSKWELWDVVFCDILAVVTWFSIGSHSSVYIAVVSACSVLCIFVYCLQQSTAVFRFSSVEMQCRDRGVSADK